MVSGGKGANQAVAAARLGGDVTLVGNLGTDSFGDTAITRLQSEGVNCRFIVRENEQASGVALISVDARGENHIVVAPGANSSMNQAQLDQALASLRAGTFLLLQLEIPLESVCYAAALAKAANCKVILDPAPAQQLPSELLSGLFLITPNETEAQSLTGIPINSIDDAKLAASRLIARGVKNVAVTLGERGVLIANVEGSEHIHAAAMGVIDTTAAGDCFNGALAAALAQNKSLADAARYACKAAAISVTRHGAQDSMPEQHELN
jgi:ribokinase